MAISLKKGVRRELQKWRASNPYRRKYSYGPAKACFLWCGRHSVRTALALVFVYSCVLWALAVFPPPYLETGWHFGPGVTYDAVPPFGAVWATQAALVAVVYPVTFGFATIFLQRQQATKATLQSYLAESGAKLTGTSSLVLVLVLTLQLPLTASSGLNKWTAFAWTVVASAWLGLNVLLTLNFLLRTLDFATPEGRRRARSEYAVMVALPHEWRRNMAYELASNPSGHALLSTTLNELDGSPRQPFFVAGGPEARMYAVLQRPIVGVKCTFRREMHVDDINYPLLEWTFKRWRKRTAEQLELQGDPLPTFTVVAMPAPARFSYGDVVAGTAWAPHLDWIETILVRLSLKYKRPARLDHELTVGDCVDEAQAEVLAAFNAGNHREFAVQLAGLTSLLDSLVEASWYEADSAEEPDCFSLAETSWHETENSEGGGEVVRRKSEQSALATISGQGDGDKPSLRVARSLAETRGYGRKREPIFANWTAALLEVLRTVLPGSGTQPTFAILVIHAPLGMVRARRQTLVPELRKRYLVLQWDCFYHVLSWSAAELARCRANTQDDLDWLPEPVATRYQSLLEAGVKAWSGLHHELVLQASKGIQTGVLSTAGRELVGNHMVQTCFLAALALRAADYLSLKATTKLLLEWNLEFRAALKMNNVAAATLEKWPWQLDVLSVPPHKGCTPLARDFEEANGTSSAFIAATTNHWSDCCSILAASAAAHARLRRKPSGLALTSTALRQLLLPSSQGVQTPLATAADYFRGLVRQFSTGAYARSLHQVVLFAFSPLGFDLKDSHAKSFQAEDMLKARCEGQAFVLAVLAARGWSFSAEEFRELFVGTSTESVDYDARYERLIRAFGYMAKRYDDGFVAQLADLWNAMDMAADIEQGMTSARDGLETACSVLKDVCDAARPAVQAARQAKMARFLQSQELRGC